MEDCWKIVNFEHYCKRCKNVVNDETCDKCDECLSVPARQFTHKPLNYEEDPKKVD